MFVPPPEFVVWETPHWLVNQRCNAALPGYLMVGAKDPAAADLADLCPAALAELGMVLQRTQQAIRDVLRPLHLYTCRFGHEAGHTIHFHIIPVCEWVAEAYGRDARYRQLQQFYAHPLDGTSAGATEFDGADMTLYICREFAESKTPPPVVGLSVAQVIQCLRGRLEDAPPAQP